jgi:hypothetical protein
VSEEIAARCKWLHPAIRRVSTLLARPAVYVVALLSGLTGSAATGALQGQAAGPADASSFLAVGLPPSWYGSGWIYAGGVVCVATGFFGLILFRRRRNSTRNRARESRVKSCAGELESKPFDPRELVASVAAETKDRSPPVAIAVSPAVPRQLRGERKRIKEILADLVDHALGFAGQGQVHVTVWCKAGGPGFVEVIFAVFDEGPGIANEEQKILFTSLGHGAAPGLARCRALAEKIGGRIWLENESGRGVCFCFSAPFAVAPLDASGTPTPAAGSSTPGQLANLRRLAAKKRTPFAQELALFLSEFAAELDDLLAALRREDVRQARHYAHLLYGRCAFVDERGLESMLRKIEADTAAGRWNDARRLAGDVRVSLADWRVRLDSDAPVVPPASDR